jgi:hypothetical protein
VGANYEKKVILRAMTVIFGEEDICRNYKSCYWGPILKFIQ